MQVTHDSTTRMQNGSVQFLSDSHRLLPPRLSRFSPCCSLPGPECKVCAESLHHIGDDGICQRCPNGAIPIIIAVGSLAGALLLTFLIGRLAFKPPKSMQAALTKVQVFLTTVRDLGPSKFKAALTFYQIICSLPKTFDLYPVSVEFEGVYKVFQFFEFDWSEAVYPRGCISGGYTARLFVIALVPILIIIAVPVLTFVLVVLFVIVGNVGACFGIVDKRRASFEVQIATAMQLLQNVSGRLSSPEDVAASSASPGSAVPRQTETKRRTETNRRAGVSCTFRERSPSKPESSPSLRNSPSRRNVTASVKEHVQRSTSQATSEIRQTLSVWTDRMLSLLPLVLLIVFIFLPAVSRSVFSVWDCQPYKVSEDSTVFYMRRDPSMECSSGDHAKLVAAAIVFVCMWPIGMQLFLFVTLWVNRKDLRMGKTTAHTRATHFLTGGYKNPYYYCAPSALLSHSLWRGACVLCSDDVWDMSHRLMSFLLPSADSRGDGGTLSPADVHGLYHPHSVRIYLPAHRDCCVCQPAGSCNDSCTYAAEKI